MQLRRRDNDAFRYVYRYFPLREIHPHAQMPAEGSRSRLGASPGRTPFGACTILYSRTSTISRLPTSSKARRTATGVKMQGYLKAMAPRINSPSGWSGNVQSGIANGVEGNARCSSMAEPVSRQADEGSLRKAIGRSRHAAPPGCRSGT